MLALNQKNNVTGYKVLFSGGMSESPIDFKIVFRAALLLGAASIIVCHNHPGGDPTPSWQDKKTTLGLNAAGDMIGIKVQDHIVLGNGRYWSFVERRVDADLIDRFLRKNRQGKKNTRGARG